MDLNADCFSTQTVAVAAFLTAARLPPTLPFGLFRPRACAPIRRRILAGGGNGSAREGGGSHAWFANRC